MSSLAVSLDLDEVFRHLAVHGRPPSSAPSRSGSGHGAAPPEDRAALHFGLPRALAWARSLKLPLTLFAVAEDTRDPSVAAALRRAAGEGHPVESHSSTHPYDLVRRSVAEQRTEIAGSVDELEAAVGVRPEGFRAPGYLVDDGVLDRVEEAGLLFDASILPCPAYVAAKVAIIAGLALRGRRSVSLPRGVRMAFAPRSPYRPGRPFDRAGDRTLVELPISVSPRLRVPAVGTLVGALPALLARSFARSLAEGPLVSLELHAMDFLEPGDPGVGSLLGAQPELNRSVGARSRALSAFVDELLGLGLRPITLREAARGFQATLPPVR